MKRLLLSLLLFAVLLGFTLFIEGFKDPIVTEKIIGIATDPDPIFEEVLMLASQGEVLDVTFLESFPVQMILTAPQSVFDSLEELRTD